MTTQMKAHVEVLEKAMEEHDRNIRATKLRFRTEFKLLLANLGIRAVQVKRSWCSFQ